MEEIKPHTKFIRSLVKTKKVALTFVYRISAYHALFLVTVLVWGGGGDHFLAENDGHFVENTGLGVNYSTGQEL